MHPRDLTYEEHQMVLESHMLPNENIDWKIKARIMAGDSKQRTYIPNDDASFPTVPTESALLTIIVNAKENSGITVIDTLNAFI